MTFSDQITRLHHAHNVEVHVLETALWIAVNGQKIIDRERFGAGVDADKFVADMTEAIRLATLLASDRGPHVERQPLGHAIELLREALGIKTDGA